jgi:hypothetical protein
LASMKANVTTCPWKERKLKLISVIYLTTHCRWYWRAGVQSKRPLVRFSTDYVSSGEGKVPWKDSGDLGSMSQDRIAR